MTPAEALEILQLARVSPIGLLLRTSNPVRARWALNDARRASPDGLEDLQIRLVNSPDGDLAVVNRHIELQRGDAA